MWPNHLGMTRWFLLYVCVLTATVVAGCGDKQPTTWVSQDGQISFQLPSEHNWAKISLTRSEAKVSLKRKDESAAIAFVEFDRKPGETLTEEFVQKWEKGLYRKRGKVKASGQFCSFKGRPAYKVLDERDDDGRISSVIIWFEGDHLMEIVASKLDTDPWEDAEIKKFMDSVTFPSRSSQEATTAESNAAPRTNL
jgi:hypothetical protein